MEINKNSTDIFYKLIESKNFDLEKLNIQKNQYDFFEIAYKALRNNTNPWQIVKTLIKLIPFSKYDEKNILKFLRYLYEKENETPIHFQITQQIARIDKNLALNLLDEFLKIKEDFCFPHIRAILIELHNTHKTNQFNTILEYLNSKDEYKQQCIIENIYLFNLSSEEMQIIFQKFNQLINYPLTIKILIINSSYYLIEKGYEYFSTILLKFINSQNENIKFNISKILLFGSEKYFEKDWFKKLFFSLLNGNTSYIINNIDLILGNLLEKYEYQIIEKFLFKWSIKGDLIKVINQLNHFVYKFNESNEFSIFITKSLNYENEKLHLVISKMIHKLFISKNISLTSLKNIKLDKIILENFNFDDYIYVIRKILGYFYEFEIINNMIFSILKVNNLSEEIKNQIKNVITDFIGRNYPYETKQFYENLNDIDLNEIEKEVKYYVLRILNKRFTDYKRLPYLKELEHPKSQVNKILRATNIVMNKELERVRKEDFLSSLFFENEIIIKYGKGSFREINGKISDVSYLQTIESKVSIPVSSQASPIALELEMTMLRLTKKGNK